MNKYLILATMLFGSVVASAQDRGSSRREEKETRKEERRQRTNAIIKQEEEGVLSYNRHNAYGFSLRSNGYGIFYEHGRTVSPRWANVFTFELTEIQHPKEERSSSAQGFLLGNSYKYGKLNNFYQAKLGYGRQYIFGQKGNKNGVAVIGTLVGGLSVGMLKPYYIQVNDNGVDRDVTFNSEDSALFVNGDIIGSSGFSSGWNQLKIRPGLYAKSSLRFDFGTYNESITALEIGFSAEGYGQRIEQMLFNEPKRVFLQAHIAVMFGNRR